MARFVKLHGGDFDELRGEMNLVYMEALADYNPGKASFKTRLQFCAWRRLGVLYRRRAGRGAVPRVQIEADLGALAAPRPPGFELTEFCARLSDDAEEVVDVVLTEGPDDLTVLNPDSHTDPGAAVRRRVREYLRRERGWADRRVTAAYHEIQRAL